MITIHFCFDYSFAARSAMFLITWLTTPWYLNKRVWSSLVLCLVPVSDPEIYVENLRIYVENLRIYIETWEYWMKPENICRKHENILKHAWYIGQKSQCREYWLKFDNIYWRLDCWMNNGKIISSNLRNNIWNVHA